MKISADQGGWYPQRPRAEVDNTLRDLQNSSYPTKAEFNNCFIIHSKYFLFLKGVSPLRSLFFRSPNITQPCPQVFSVEGSIICSGQHFWRHRFNNFRWAPLLTSLIQYGEGSFWFGMNSNWKYSCRKEKRLSLRCHDTKQMYSGLWWYERAIPTRLNYLILKYFTNYQS